MCSSSSSSDSEGGGGVIGGVSDGEGEGSDMEGGASPRPTGDVEPDAGLKQQGEGETSDDVHPQELS